jgi:ABC-type hemin transport system substrate-binding protein
MTTMNAASNWDGIVSNLEAQARTVRAGQAAKELKERVEDAMSNAEKDASAVEVLDRLDSLLIVLTEASRDVCTNTKCPHYNKKCKMR